MNRKAMDIPEHRKIVMCVECKGFGTVGGYLSPEELCKVCKGAGSVERVEYYE